MPETGGLARWLEAGWYRQPPRLPLRPLAALFGWGAAVRRAAFRSGLLSSAHPGIPTVVVGNLAVGGTGKTPLVIWLVQRLQQRGCRPGIVSRGHGGAQRSAHLVDPADSAALVGDEAVLLARRTGARVAVGRRRLAAAQLLRAAGCDIIVADDGLQHLAMHRDLDIVVIDGARGLGNGALLPAGPLREPSGRLHEAGLVVVHGTDVHHVVPPELAPLTMHLAPLPLRRVADDAEADLARLRGTRVHALAGIGNPDRFFAQLRAEGLDPIDHPRPDHHRYSAQELVPGDGLPVVMTEKDAVKCTALALGRQDVFYLPVSAGLPEPDAMRLIDQVLAIGRA